MKRAERLLEDHRGDVRAAGAPRALQYAATAAVVLAHFQIYGAVLATIPVPETPGTPGTKSGVWNWYCNCRGDSCESGDGCDCCTC
jgi:hypothetical protein